MKNSDVIIIGSGIAAMQLAHNLSSSLFVRLITKSTLSNSNSYFAQGGIAAAVSSDDNYRLHYQDTIEAGEDFHTNEKVLDLVKEAPNLINRLINSGVQFDSDEHGTILLGKEGAHCRNRILHCGGDATGKYLMDHFLKKVPKNINMIENEFVYELIIHPNVNKCIGVKTRNSKGEANIYFASHIILAVGGVGGLYAYTSNASSVAGDGVALAYMAGAKLTDLEFIQFHPTLLTINGKACGLVSEAVRGMGAVLINDANEPIMAGKHPLNDLAPRHIVAQEIYFERSKGNEVYLDIHMIKHFKEKFPTITAMCENYQIDLSKGKIPVAPGCHFFMGGIVIDEVGRTSINGLYAIGETAWSGVHGANRLASNSLLEGLYYGEKLASYLNEQTNNNVDHSLHIQINNQTKKRKVHLPNKLELQNKLMDCAGIIRSKMKLEELKIWLGNYEIIKHKNLHLDQFETEDIQMIFMLITAKLITEAALLRTESRGGHIREDFPLKDPEWARKHIFHTKHSTEVRSNAHEYSQIKIHA
ncbi:L-aspartate oxidase [Heyndrickxia vini]|uniref:L-aspartate oxidase n=1 Tax=Heyndrickxia vini TaxID=1476025 RepID=A0ABX7E4R5_9BACI|nr:L-aspartate oxidase [Heyndrickxia vini]QQZ10734.1 L-aspartate oxidase [Heyndrickxia vini]